MTNSIVNYNVETLPTSYNTYVPSKNMNPFFQVQRFPLFADNNGTALQVERDALFSPNGSMLGVVSKRYQVVNNSDVAKLFDDFFSGMRIDTVKDMVSGNGEKWLREYVVDEDKYMVNVKGDDLLKLKVTVSNGYDAKSGVNFALSFWRQICSNGMMGWKREIGQKFSHFTTDILGKLGSILDFQFNKAVGVSSVWNKWADLPFNKEDFVGFVNSRDYLTDKKKENTIGFYEPIMNKYNENETKWGAYNVLTAIATHHTSSRDKTVSNVFSSGYKQMERLTKDFWEYKKSA